MIPDVKLADFEKDEAGQKVSPEEARAAYTEAKKVIDDHRSAQLSNTSEATVFRTRRGGQAFRPDAEDNFFDRVKAVLGPVTRVFVSTDQFTGMRTHDQKKFVTKEYEPGIVTSGDVSAPYSGNRSQQPKAIDREKLAARSANKASTPNESNVQTNVATIFKKIKPVLWKLGNEAMAIIKRRIQAQMSGGNFEATQKAAQAGNKIQQFLATIDKSEDLDLNDPMYSGFVYDLTAALRAEAGRKGITAYSLQNVAIADTANGTIQDLKLALDAVRNMLVGVGT